MARKQTDIPIGIFQARTIPAVPEHLPMAAARKVAALKQVDVLFVERDGRLIGSLDEHALAAGRRRRVAASMTAIGACLHPEMSASRARDLFAWLRVSVCPSPSACSAGRNRARRRRARALAEPAAPRRARAAAA